MTTIQSQSGSSSPQWDSRNKGFIPPAELQQLRQSSPQNNRPGNVHQFPQRLQSDPVSETEQRPTIASQSHSRASSFFSFRKSVDLQQQQQQQPPTLHAPQPVSSQPNPDDLNRQSQLMNNSPPPTRRLSSSGNPNPAPLHPEIRSVLQLNVAQAHKVYFSGPLVRHIERLPDGHKSAKTEDWTDVWAQLGGTTLSIWDMKAIEEANKIGKEVPPTYVNVTDAFVQVLASVTIPATQSSQAKRYTNIITLNTAGSNLLLFACPSTAALFSWTAAVRLSAWEKSRLEEIYTAHLIRIHLTNGGRDTPSTLIRGRMEGWARIRVAGQTDWKRMWMVVTSGTPGFEGGASLPENHPNSPSPPRKKRMSNLFSREHSPARDPSSPGWPQIALYTSQKPKDRKRAFLTMRSVTQAFAMYPERLELISKSTLMKIEGLMGDEEGAGGMRTREGWLMVMPEVEGHHSEATEMLKWVVALHDAFELYGRPRSYTWDPRDPVSMMFSYPVGQDKDSLFLDLMSAETLDPRDDRTSAMRSRFTNILHNRMRGIQIIPQGPSPQPGQGAGAPTLPPLLEQQQQPLPPIQATNGAPSLPQLPSFSFEPNPPNPATSEKRTLTPITEMSGGMNSRSMSGEQSINLPHRPSLSGNPSTVTEASQESKRVSDGPITTSPTQLSPENVFSSPSLDSGGRSQDSLGFAGSSSRPDSKLTPSFDTSQSKLTTEDSTHPELANTKSLASPRPPSRGLGSPPLPPAQPSERVPPASPTPSRMAVVQNARPASPFSVPKSPHSIDESSRQRKLADDFRTASQTSSAASPQPHSLPKTPRRSTNTLNLPRLQPDETVTNLFDEAGALYYMQQFEQKTEKATSPRRKPSKTSDSESSDSGSSSEFSRNRPTATSKLPPTQPLRPQNRSPPITQTRTQNRNTVQQGRSTALDKLTTADSTTTTASSSERSGGVRDEAGRKPSGARVLPSARQNSAAVETRSTSPRSVYSEDTMSEPERAAPQKKQPSPLSSPAQPSQEDVNADALAALSFLAGGEEAPTKSAVPEPPRAQKAPDATLTVTGRTPSPPDSQSDNVSQYRSSFALSKQAAERKARSEAQQAAHQAAVHKPGRSKSKRKGKAVDRGGWHGSSDEEEDEEEEDEDDDEDEDDVDSDGEPTRRAGNPAGFAPGPTGAMGRPFQQGNGSAVDIDAPQPRPPRHLPQIPAGTSPRELEAYGGAPPPRRMLPDQYSEAPRRGYYDEPTQAQLRSQAEYPQPGAARQNLWSQVLEPGRAGDLVNARDTFVQLEPASETMTKAFTPQGLLSAGLQDKQDRSAKRQEELARESGASLINVPNKPPPPQTGLLGAITAHERERKREGGMGAALTEREREKRLAEERQRKLDEFQRQQLDQMAQGGSMYGGQFPGFNPMMGNPMMMGLNPMMTGMNPMMATGMNPMMTGMGYPGFGANQQHMFAAQQAAQAYQQAMMAFSVAGSQVGGGDAPLNPMMTGQGAAPMNPMMTGQGAAPMNPMMTGGSMGGFDPRFSMMGMPMMGMGMQMPGGGAGVGGYDPRFSGGMMEGGLRPQGDVGAQGQFSSRNSSAGGQGSPMSHAVEPGERPLTGDAPGPKA